MSVKPNTWQNACLFPRLSEMRMSEWWPVFQKTPVIESLTSGLREMLKCKKCSKLFPNRTTQHFVNHAKTTSCSSVALQSLTSIYPKLVIGIACQVWISFLQGHLTPMKGSSLPRVSQVTERQGTVARRDPVCIQCGSTGAEMTFIAKTFYDLKATTLEGDLVDFNVFRGRVVLIENVASLWGTTTRDYSELNQLQSKYPHRLVVLGFPCNQFGYQVIQCETMGCKIAQNDFVCWRFCISPVRPGSVQCSQNVVLSTRFQEERFKINLIPL